MSVVRRLVLLVVGAYALLLIGCAAAQRKLLYYPSHRAGPGDLTPWRNERDELIGFARDVAAPKTVWLLLHGNAGQATDRTYALPSFANDDAVYILEYPGYGARGGSPSLEAFNTAAAEAYTLLRAKFPRTPVCVAAESIGSGPGCSLALQSPPPDKIALVVPFDNLASVASEHLRFIPVGLLLRDRWDNVAALATYRGPVEIFAAEQDTVIPPHHAKHLADSKPGAVWHQFRGGHNDWSASGAVKFRYP